MTTTTGMSHHDAAGLGVAPRADREQANQQNEQMCGMRFHS